MPVFAVRTSESGIAAAVHDTYGSGQHDTHLNRRRFQHVRDQAPGDALSSLQKLRGKGLEAVPDAGNVIVYLEKGEAEWDGPALPEAIKKL